MIKTPFIPDLMPGNTLELGILGKSFWADVCLVYLGPVEGVMETHRFSLVIGSKPIQEVLMTKVGDEFIQAIELEEGASND